mmetsp:Transcript_27881/g.91705  ORF Transcript_27881/g.91705 Transcript_27881/m.91705 type:complete len:254 (+) Transcript_27881:63-824(+)
MYRRMPFPSVHSHAPRDAREGGRERRTRAIFLVRKYHFRTLRAALPSERLTAPATRARRSLSGSASRRAVPVLCCWAKEAMKAILACSEVPSDIGQSSSTASAISSIEKSSSPSMDEVSIPPATISWAMVTVTASTSQLSSSMSSVTTASATFMPQDSALQVFWQVRVNMKFSSSIVHNNAPAVCMPAQVFIIVMAPAGMACKSSAGIMATIVGRFSSLSAQPPSSVPNAAAEASSTESSKARIMEGKAGGTN